LFETKNKNQKTKPNQMNQLSTMMDPNASNQNNDQARVNYALQHGGVAANRQYGAAPQVQVAQYMQPGQYQTSYPTSVSYPASQNYSYPSLYQQPQQPTVAYQQQQPVASTQQPQQQYQVFAQQIQAAVAQQYQQAAQQGQQQVVQQYQQPGQAQYPVAQSGTTYGIQSAAAGAYGGNPANAYGGAYGRY
jgi:hypothetical protein